MGGPARGGSLVGWTSRSEEAGVQGRSHWRARQVLPMTGRRQSERRRAKRQRQGGRRREKQKRIKERKVNEKISRGDNGGRRIKMRNVRLDSFFQKLTFIFCGK